MDLQVSAIIATYNYAPYVTRAVDSILNQTHPVSEIVVVDDGSTDNTREVLAAYGDRIRYIHRVNGGVSAARNTGIRAARYKWVALLDADDYWFPNKIERQLDAIRRQPDLDFVYTALRTFDQAGNEKDRIVTPANQLWPRLRWTNLITPSTVMIRREMLLEVGGFDESVRWCEDWELWVRLGEKRRFGCVPEQLTGYQYTPASLSTNIERMLGAARNITETTLLSGLPAWSKPFWRRRIVCAELFRASVAYRSVNAERARACLWASIFEWPSPFFWPLRWRALLLEIVKGSSSGLKEDPMSCD